jgi:hypothetical protein
MTGKSAYTIVPPSAPAVQDEWGMFDPNQAGLQAAFRAVRALDSPATSGEEVFAAGNNTEPPEDSNHAEAAASAAVRNAAPPAALFTAASDRAIRDRRGAPRGAGPTRVPSQLAATADTVYDLTEPEPRLRQQKPAERGTVYSLEFPTRCPQCCTEINTVRVSRLLRTQVSFTSTLPRKGYIIVCPECDGILSAELSGLI